MKIQDRPYDLAESQAEAASCAQIEYDQRMSLLYSIGCESQTAGENMPTLCAMAGIDYGKLLDYSPVSF